MNQTTVEKGRAGDADAALRIRAHGYRILCFNFRVNRYEIDLVAKKVDCVVFVEVKTRKTKAQSCRFDLIRVLTDENSVKVEHLKDAFDSSAFLI